MVKRSNQKLSRHLQRVQQCKSCHKIFISSTDKNVTSVCNVSLKCGSYFCPECSKHKRYKLISRLSKSVKDKKLRFLTLTFDTKQYSPEQTYELGSHYFNLFIKYLKYYNFKFQYFKVLEFTKQHYAHYHVILDCFIPIHLIKRLWQKITGSFIVFIKPVRSAKKLISYLLYYLTKVSSFDLNKIFYQYSLRRYSYSRHFFLFPIIKNNWIDTKIFYSGLDFPIDIFRNYCIFELGFDINFKFIINNF